MVNVHLYNKIKIYYHFKHKKKIKLGWRVWCVTGLGGLGELGGSGMPWLFVSSPMGWVR